MGHFIQLYSGNFFDFENIDQNVILVEDIAHALSNQCRWSGHTIEFFPVGEHVCQGFDVAIFKYNDKELADEVLHHDDGEGYCIDVPRPIKAYVPGYGSLLKNVEKRVAEAFKQPFPMSQRCREIDDTLLITDYRRIVDIKHQKRVPEFETWPYFPYSEQEVTYNFWTPKQAEYEYLKRHLMIKDNLSIEEIKKKLRP